MKKSLYDYGEFGLKLFLVYCLLDTPWEKQKVMVVEVPKPLNAGRPWMCKDNSGVTGVVGMTIWADTATEAAKKMGIVKAKLNEAGEEPAVWT